MLVQAIPGRLAQAPLGYARAIDHYGQVIPDRKEFKDTVLIHSQFNTTDGIIQREIETVGVNVRLMFIIKSFVIVDYLRAATLGERRAEFRSAPVFRSPSVTGKQIHPGHSCGRHMEHLHPVFQDALHHEPSRVASENQTQSRRIATQIPKRLTHLTPGLFRQSDISTPQLSPPSSVNLSSLFQRVDPSSLSVKDSRRDEKQRRHKNQNIPFHHNIYLQYANILLYSRWAFHDTCFRVLNF